VLYAPMDGVVSARHAEPGTLLGVGSKVLTLTQLNPLRFQLAVPTTLFAQLALDRTGIRIEVDAYPGQPVDGVVSRIYPVADDATRTIRIETILDNADGRYMPGMYATGVIALDRRENALAVPYDAVIRNGDERIVYRMKDGRAEAVTVKLGIRQDAIVEVLEGLADTDEIIVAGQHRLSDGVPVKLEAAP
jgi:membrane fusion protein (multidrug efflux system)